MSEPSITTIPSTPQPISRIWLVCLVAIVLQILLTAPAHAADEYFSVTVADPYLEMRTGPGRGYPIFTVVDRGETVDVIMQRTHWYQVRAADGREGWVERAQMELTLRPDDSAVSFDKAGLDDFTHSKWEAGLLTGDFGGANIISLYGGYSLNPYVSARRFLVTFRTAGWQVSMSFTRRSRNGVYHHFLLWVPASFTRAPRQR